MAARLPRSIWPKQREGWDLENWGDRKQCLVFICRSLDVSLLKAQLEECLLTLEEATELLEGEGDSENESKWSGLAKEWVGMLEAGQEEKLGCY